MRDEMRDMNSPSVATFTSEIFQGLTNRWLIAVSSLEAAECLVRDGVLLYNQHINVRHYDDVLVDEYNEYHDSQSGVTHSTLFSARGANAQC